MKKKLTAIAVILAALPLLYAVGTTVNGTRIISNALTVQGILTAANGAILGIPASVTLTNATGLPLSGLVAQAADALVINATAGSASPTAVVMPTCTTGADLYNTSTHAWSCVGTGGSFPWTFVQESQQNSGVANVNSFTFTFPQTTAASGNTAWLMCGSDGSATVGLPSGWTADLNITQATYARFILLHKTTAAESSAAFTLTSSNMACYFWEQTGSHALDQSSTGGIANAAVVTLPAITPTANSIVFGMVAYVTTGASVLQSSPVNPVWRSLQAENGQNGGRVLAGFVSTVAATNVSTTPPQFGFNGVGLFASGGIAYATFSIL